MPIAFGLSSHCKVLFYLFVLQGTKMVFAGTLIFLLVLENGLT